MTIRKAQKYLLEKGYAFRNPRGKTKPIVFKLMGFQWTTNKNRIPEYSMDDKEWYIIKLPLWKKIWWILNGKVKALIPDEEVIR